MEKKLAMDLKFAVIVAIIMNRYDINGNIIKTKKIVKFNTRPALPKRNSIDCGGVTNAKLHIVQLLWKKVSNVIFLGSGNVIQVMWLIISLCAAVDHHDVFLEQQAGGTSVNCCSPAHRLRDFNIIDLLDQRAASNGIVFLFLLFHIV